MHGSFFPRERLKWKTDCKNYLSVKVKKTFKSVFSFLFVLILTLSARISCDFGSVLGDGARRCELNEALCLVGVAGWDEIIRSWWLTALATLWCERGLWLTAVAISWCERAVWLTSVSTSWYEMGVWLTTVATSWCERAVWLTTVATLWCERAVWLTSAATFSCERGVWLASVGGVWFPLVGCRLTSVCGWDFTFCPSEAFTGATLECWPPSEDPVVITECWNIQN